MDKLASISHELLDLNEGIYNICADEKISKFEFGILLVKFEIVQHLLAVDQYLIERIL